MVRVRRLFALLFAGILAIALSACAPLQFQKDSAQVPRFVYSIISDPKTFNEVLSEESPNVFTLISEGLIAQNGVTGELEPALAESWEISEDNLKIVFTPEGRFAVVGW